MRSRPYLALAAVVLSAAAVSAACRGPAAARRDTVVIGQPTSAITLDPHRHDSYHTNLVLSHFYDKLVTLGAGLEMKPGLAVSWENPTERVWRFHLRQGVVFHDGRPFGAADVVTSLNRARSPEAHTRHYLQPVEDVRTVDDATVEVTTREPSVVLLYDLVFISIVPRDSGTAPIERPVGTGPYVFAGGKAGGSIEGTRFARYWGPAPAFEKVVLIPLQQARERAEAVPLGRADIVVQLPEELWDWTLKQPHTRLLTHEVPDVFMLALSMKPGPLADRRVREALALAIDRTALVARGMSGRAAPLDQIVPSGVFGHASELGKMPHDVDGARRLLKEAGVTGGFETSLMAPDVARPLAEELARQLGAIGIRLRVTVLAQDDFYRRWSRDPLPLVLLGWSFSNGDASSGLAPLLHTPGPRWGTFNLGGYANPGLDELIEQSERSLDPHRRAELLASAMRTVQEDLPVIPLVTRPGLFALRDDLVWSPSRDRVHAADLALRE